MKNKANLIQGIIFCAQGIILDAFALNAIIPALGGLWFGDLGKREGAVATFTLVIWLGISIAASVVLGIGKTKIMDYYSVGVSSVNYGQTYNVAPTAAQVSGNINNNSATPSSNEWKCPNCGRINQNYTGTCGCGQQKPVR